MDIVWQAEDSLREKKVENDLRDLLKTLVAFANSVAPGDTAQLFIGEKDDGTVQGVTNAESINRSVATEAAKIYPPIYYRTEVYERDGKQCVRVDIKHNGQAPHFGGASWVRHPAEQLRSCATLVVAMQMLNGVACIRVIRIPGNSLRLLDARANHLDICRFRALVFFAAFEGEKCK